MEDMAWDLGERIERADHGNIVDIGLSGLRDIESWCGAIGGILRVRALGALIDEHSSEDLLAACAEGIAQSDQWQVLLSELLVMSETTRACMMVAKQVMERRMDIHPLALLASQPQYAATICDAMVADGYLTFRVGHPIEGREWIFVDPQNPVAHATAIAVEHAGDIAKVPVTELKWLDANYAACSAFIVVV